MNWSLWRFVSTNLLLNLDKFSSTGNIELMSHLIFPPFLLNKLNFHSTSLFQKFVGISILHHCQSYRRALSVFISENFIVTKRHLQIVLNSIWYQNQQTIIFRNLGSQFFCENSSTVRNENVSMIEVIRSDSFYQR